MLEFCFETFCCSYEENSEWEIVGRSVKREEFHFKCCPTELFSFIAFSVAIRRRHEFYVMNVVLPGVLTSALLLSIFYCVPSQKVHIGVAALLSFRLFLVNVADTVPRTSDHIPLLGTHHTCATWRPLDEFVLAASLLPSSLFLPFIPSIPFLFLPSFPSVLFREAKLFKHIKLSYVSFSPFLVRKSAF